MLRVSVTIPFGVDRDLKEKIVKKSLKKKKEEKINWSF